MIEVKSLSKNFKKQVALREVSFEIKKNSIFGIVGPNGSGKSTLIKIMTDLIKSFKGQVKLDGLTYTDMSLASEEFGFPSYYSVYKVIRLFSLQKNATEEQVEKVIERLQLKVHIKKNISELSQGLKQRLNIACAILGDFEVIIFDEPNNGLDPDGFLMLRDLIKELKESGKTVIIASHLLNELELICDHVLFLKDGFKIVQDETRNLISTYGSLENAYLSISNIK